MTYLILGGAGQLAQSFRRLLGDQAVALARAQADLAQPEQLRRALLEFRPHVVINCAADNLVDRAETEAASAWAVNALGPAHLADLCRGHGSLLVHFSTNYVFGLDETRQTPYREQDEP